MENGCSSLLPTASNPSREINYQYYMDNSVPESDSKSTVSPMNSTSSSKKESQEPSVNYDLAHQGSICIEDTKTQSSLALYSDIQEINDKLLNAKDGQSTVTLALEPIKGRSDSIVFQTKTDQSVCDSSKNEFEGREIQDRDTAILGPDGKVICTGTTRGIEKIVRHLTAQIELAHRRMDQSNTNMYMEKCDICKC